MPIEVVTTCDDCGSEDRAQQDSYNGRIRPPEGWQNRFVGGVMLIRCGECGDAISTAKLRAEGAAIAQALEERRRIVADARARNAAPPAASIGDATGSAAL